MTTKERLHFIIRFPDSNLHMWQGEICDSFWQRNLAEDYLKHPPDEHKGYHLVLAVQEV